MKYIIEQGARSGYAIFEQLASYDDQQLLAVALTKQDIADFFGDGGRPRPTALKLAQDLAKCFRPDQDMCNKISMIKLVRDATDCGLKEAKEAVEQAMDARTVSAFPDQD